VRHRRLSHAARRQPTEFCLALLWQKNGCELRRQGDPEQVRVHDFKIPEIGKVAPYGVYDIAANHGWVSVGIDADTGAFAVESIRRWW
jgi:Rhodopirellula transposase DDE domain